jgi:hypothetical protein
MVALRSGAEKPAAQCASINWRDRIVILVRWRDFTNRATGRCALSVCGGVAGVSLCQERGAISVPIARLVPLTPIEGLQRVERMAAAGAYSPYGSTYIMSVLY